MKYIWFIKKGVHFFLRYARHDIMFVVRYFFAYFNLSFSVAVQTLTKEMFIDELKSGKSYIRMGDGEVALIHGLDIHFQKYDKDLALGLHKLVCEYSDSSPYVLGIPTRYITKTNHELRSINLLRCWLPFMVSFKQFFPKKVNYFDAHSFYVSGFFENTLMPIFEDRTLIIISRSETVQKMKVSFAHKPDTVFIVAPDENSFSEIDTIEQKVIEQIHKIKNPLVLVASGPMSKILTHRLATQKIQSLDVGHGMEHIYQPTGLDHVLI